MSKLLFDEQPLVISRELAKLIGLNESIVLQQVHYWLEINRKADKNFHDGRYWTYNTMKSWQEKEFAFWSFNTVKRTFTSLVNKGYLILGNYNHQKFDQTKWYSIDYEALETLISPNSSNWANAGLPISPKWANASGQNEPMDKPNLGHTIPETNTETISTDKKKVSKKETALPAFDELIENYTSNLKLQEAIKEFIKMRVSMKKVPTNRALEIIFEKLDKMTSNDEAKIEILNRSIVNNWGDIFELKPPQGSLKIQQKNGGSPLEDLKDFLREEKDEQFN